MIEDLEREKLKLETKIKELSSKYDIVLSD